MSQRQTKKLRRWFNKEARARQQLIYRALKPKPRWCPAWLWLKGLKIFVRVQEK